MSAPIEGHCLCGAVTYKADAEPVMSVICHCADCQRQSGSLGSFNVIFPRDAFEMTGDSLAVFETTGTDTGQPRERWFCSGCGSSIATFAVELPLAIVKGGTLDDPQAAPPPAIEMWADSGHDWFPEAEGRQRFGRGIPAG